MEIRKRHYESQGNKFLNLIPRYMLQCGKYSSTKSVVISPFFVHINVTKWHERYQIVTRNIKNKQLLLKIKRLGGTVKYWVFLSTRFSYFVCYKTKAMYFVNLLKLFFNLLTCILLKDYHINITIASEQFNHIYRSFTEILMLMLACLGFIF